MYFGGGRGGRRDQEDVLPVQSVYLDSRACRIALSHFHVLTSHYSLIFMFRVALLSHVFMFSSLIILSNFHYVHARVG